MKLCMILKTHFLKTVQNITKMLSDNKNVKSDFGVIKILIAIELIASFK